MGISWAEFWEMNPKIIEAHIQGQKEELEYKNALFHLNGLYTAEALKSTIGNMFKKKTEKPYSYPEKPIDLNLNKIEEKDLTEEDKINQTNDLFQMLRIMEMNFNITHGKEDE